MAQVVKVTDAQTGEPLAWVSIFSKERNAQAVTDESGSADISAMRGAADIEFQLLGYAPLRRSYFELERSNYRVALEPWTLSLQQVVVSASRWRQSRRQVPNNILSISPNDVSLVNPQTAADLLGSTGSVFIQKSQQGGGSPMIRGFATNRVLIAVDGVRMNTAIFRSGNLQNVISIDPYSLSGAEVLFGPGSVMFGSDAIGGVMHFQTRQPAFSQDDNTLVHAGAALRHASANGELTTHFDASAAGKKWALLSSFTFNHFGDLRMGRHGPDEYLRHWYVERIEDTDVTVTNPDPLVQRPTGFDMVHLLNKIAFRPSDKWELTYGMHYSTTSDYGRYDRLIRTRQGKPRSAEWNYGPQVWLMNHLQVDHRHQGPLYDELRIHLAHQFFEESRIDRNFNSPLRNVQVEKVDAWSANLDLRKQISPRSELFYGIEAILDEVNSTGRVEDIEAGTTAIGPSRYPQASWTSLGAYLTLQHQLSDKLRSQASARYSHFGIDASFDTTFYPFPFTSAKLDDGAMTGAMGLIWFPSEKWTLSLNAATGFRSPNVDDMGKVFDSTPGAVVVPNPNLRAEYAWHAELGLARLFGNHLKLDASAFYTLLDNALVRRDYTLDGKDSILYKGELSRVQAIQNAASARVYGLQLHVEVKLAAGFGFHGNVNFQHGEEELDDGSTSPSRHAAPWFGALHATYHAYGLKLDLNLRFSGKKDFDDLPAEEREKDYLYAIDSNGNPWSPGWYTLNLQTHFRVNDNLAISAGVENLLDKRYRPYSSGIAAAGRNVVMSVQGRF